jgi:hypothetical protein
MKLFWLEHSLSMAVAWFGAGCSRLAKGPSVAASLKVFVSDGRLAFDTGLSGVCVHD